MRLMVDLYSGLGGASEAMFQSPNWEIMRFDNNPLLEKVPHTFIQDAQTNPMLHPRSWGEKKVDLLWASPPCTDFSQAFSAPEVIARREGRIEEYQPDLTLVKFALKVRDWMEPKWFVLENVAGAIKHFLPLMGPPTQIIGPFVLWGKFPHISMPVGWSHSKYDGDSWSTDPLRANKRGKIPMLLSQGLLEAIETQTTLDLWTV